MLAKPPLEIGQMKWLKDYFDLSKKEEKGFIALLCIVFFLFGLQFFIVYFVPSKKTDFGNLKKFAGQLQAGKTDSIKLDSLKSTELRAPKKTLTTPVDLNTADSIKLMTIKGIGPTFAGRILAFRRNLGCFMEINQLLDVQGIGPEKFRYLQPQVCLSRGHPKILNINTASFNDLVVNPYINMKQAHSILQYRKSYRKFSSLNDLKKITAMDEITFAKISGYIAIK